MQVTSPSPLKVDPELRGQIFGYWFDPEEEILDRPIGPPTGAVLPRPGSSFRDAELLCLDLVPVDNYWLVLSELGRYTVSPYNGHAPRRAMDFRPRARSARRLARALRGDLRRVGGALCTR